MALSGHLSDLSLSELIEFFCNQRKTGQLKVLYPRGAGYFRLQGGSVVDARIGALRGIDAVYFALTLPNAEFEFGDSMETVERTINQPWTQVVLEGLRRLDEGVVPPNAFSPERVEECEEANAPPQLIREAERVSVPSFLVGSEARGKRRIMTMSAVVVAVVASVGAIGVPAGWYGRVKTATASQPLTNAATTQLPAPAVAEVPGTETPSKTAESPEIAEHDDAAAASAKRLHELERERSKAREGKTAAPTQAAPAATAPASASAELPKSGSKKISVTVTYDESGRVTQASGGDASAIRIARQKRFPAGKAGSATITIPIN